MKERTETKETGKGKFTKLAIEGQPSNSPERLIDVTAINVKKEENNGDTIETNERQSQKSEPKSKFGLKTDVKIGGKGVSLESNMVQIGQTSTSVVMEIKADPKAALVKGDTKGSSKIVLEGISTPSLDMQVSGEASVKVELKGGQKAAQGGQKIAPPVKATPAKAVSKGAKEEKKTAKVVWDAKDTAALANTNDPVEAEKLVLRYFASVDVDGSGFIEKEEMVTVVKSLYEIEISKRPEFKDALARKDPKILEAIRVETEKIAIDTIKKMDLDKDGRVSQAEMVKSIVDSKQTTKPGQKVVGKTGPPKK